MRWYYVLNEDHTVSRVSSMDEWAMKFEFGNSNIDWTGNESLHVSTIFLGIDHGFGRTEQPILFETLIRGGPHDNRQERYCTYDEAIEGHNMWCKLVFMREGVGDGRATF
jgi:hypothetical protein